MINECEFLSVYNKYPPNWWSKTAYKYFSSSTVGKDLWLRRTFVIIMGILFAVGFVATIITGGEARKIIAPPTIIYSILLAVVVLFIFIGVKMNNMRIKRICKELGVKYDEYEFYVKLYLTGENFKGTIY